MGNNKMKRKISAPVGIVIGGGVSFVTTMLGSLLLAMLLNGNQIEISSLGYCVMVVTLISAAAGSITSAKLVERMKLPAGLGSGVMYLLMQFCVTALIFDGEYQGVGVTALLIAGGSVSALLVSVREKRGNRKKYKKMRNR